MAEQPADADVAQLVERNLAKVEVAGSNLVIRSTPTKPLPPGKRLSLFYGPLHQTSPLIRPPGSRTLIPLTLLATAVLWGITLAYNRPLFLDEANVARNLFDRSYAGLFSPLDHEQYAPPLYLVLAKLCGETFGYSETPLRIPALLGGLLAAAGLTLAGRRYGLGNWTVLPLLLLFVNPIVLRYLTEVKPYGIDLGLAAVLWACYPVTGIVEDRIILREWTLIGVVAPWLSLPAVFLLGTLGARGFLKNRKWGWPILAWLLSFLLLYLTVLSPSISSPYLTDYHRSFFLVFPDSVVALRQIGLILLGVLRLSFGVTAFTMIWGVGLAALALYRSPGSRWLIAPLLLAFAASAFGQYSLMPRLLFFTLPGIWLLTGLGAAELWELAPGRFAKLAIVGAAVVSLGGSSVQHRFVDPLTFGDGRNLAMLSSTGRYAVHPLAEAVVDYYHRIHPFTSRNVRETKIPYPAEERGDFILLYDVLTGDGPRRAMQRDSTEAAVRGCRVNGERLYLAAAWRVRCP